MLPDNELVSCAYDASVEWVTARVAFDVKCDSKVVGTVGTQVAFREMRASGINTNRRCAP